MPLHEGGRILGQGRYGCAFEPALHCKKTKHAVKKSERKIGKITTPQSAKIEFSISEKLRTIANAEDYYVLIEELCTPLPRSKQTESELSECEAIEKRRLTDMAQLIMPFGGKSLFSLIHKVNQIDFFGFGKHLLEAGALLLTKHIVHTDIHPMNILMSSKNKCKLIDFGLSWTPEQLTLSNLFEVIGYRHFEPEIWAEPPEISYIVGIQNNIPVDMILARIKDENKHLETIKRMFGVPKESLIDDLEYFIMTSKSIQTDNLFSFYKLYWSKIDAWAIGVNLLLLFRDFSMDSYFESLPEYKQYREKILKVMKGLCEMDPGKRLDAAEALRLWAPESAVLKHPDVRSWLETQDKFRKQLEQILPG